ncbi:hypothetical protein K3495_g12160 [Podosphaera aphanis]|nr:hypothetical protein K3495_g12160 [Podosphaera aphanis]
MSGANSTSSVTVQVEGTRKEILLDRYRSECLTQKQNKRPAWMFYGTIFNGREGTGTFWDRAYGKMDSVKYDQHILPRVQQNFEEQLEGRTPWLQQGNAPSYTSVYTRKRLQARQIRTFAWPPYFPELNLIEHVWSLMKQYIQTNDFLAGYDASRIGNDGLQQILQEAWDSVTDADVENLYESWWDRCDAVIQQQGGSTWY